MQNNKAEEDRNVIPRWRSPAVAESWELAAARDLNNAPLTNELFADQLELWRAEGTVSAAVDIYDTGILIGDKRLQLEGVGPILLNREKVPPALLEDVRRTLAPTVNLQARRERLAQLELNSGYLRHTIRMLKKRITEHGRDVLALLDISRLYVLSGQAEAGELYIRRAIALAPNNRLVLRSATVYYKLAGDLIDILPALRTNDAVAYDPLIQSTEIAASHLAGKGSRFALTALRGLKGEKSVSLSRSELALAVATVEHSAGLTQRRVFQMVRAGLTHGTENAQAQAVWLGEQADRPLNILLPKLSFSDNAFEAKALALVETEDYVAASNQARAWLNDQPFEADPISVVCNCHAIHLDTPEAALSLAERGYILHPDNWSVQNAILLVYIRSNNLARAKSVLNNIWRIAHQPASAGVHSTIQAFFWAGTGMLTFREGNYAYARDCYTKAIAFARTARRPDLVFSAAVFWIHAEAAAGILDGPTFTTINGMIDITLKKHPPMNKDYSTKLWKEMHRKILPLVCDEKPHAAELLAKPLDRLLIELPANIEAR